MLKVLRAIELAVQSHGFTPRKLRQVPYMIHPIRVMMKLADYLENWPSAIEFKMQTETILCVAALHDVPEDTNTTIEKIEEKFGQEIAEGVDWLTNESKRPGTLAADGTPLKHKQREERFAANIARLRVAPDIWKIVKMFDRIDNLYDMLGEKPKFVLEIYIPESKILHAAIGKADIIVAEQLWSAITWLEAITKGHVHKEKS